MFGVLINKEGYKITFDVLGTFEEMELTDGQRVIEKDWAIANSMNNPKWNFDKEIWEETDLKEKNVEIDKTKICLTQEQRAIQDLSIELAKLKLKLQLLNK